MAGLVPAIPIGEEQLFSSRSPGQMPELKLQHAQEIVATTLQTARGKSMKPLAVAVYDARGALRAFAAEDGGSLKRAEIAMGKAQGALAMGLGSRALFKRATEQPYFIAAVTHAVGVLIPVPGGVLMRDEGGTLVGAVGVSGDASDNDELAAIAGIEAAGLVADTGA
jgi:uncharacterized protein GlcG (DUF336 family)